MTPSSKLIADIIADIAHLKPGETWHPIPDLCLLTQDELDDWACHPGRRVDAIAAVFEVVHHLGSNPTNHAAN